MTQPVAAALGPPLGGPSERSRLARVALEAALAVPGVVRGEAGGGVPRVTVDPAGRLVGVAATAQRDGRYALDLRLIAEVVPLLPLADGVRARVQRAAAQAGLAGALGRVDVEFANLLTVEPAPSTPAPATAPVPAPGSVGPASAGALGPPPPTPGGAG